VGTIALYPNASADVWPGGTITLAVVFETAVGSNSPVAASGVTITIAASGADDGGSGTPVPATSTGVQSPGLGQFRYVWAVAPDTVTGSYLVTWSGVRASDGVTITYQQAVMVAAAPAPTPVPGVYATVTQYQNKTGDLFTPNATVAQRLRLASEQLDVYLVGAVYGVDGDGMPTDPGLIDTLSRACCEQARFLTAHNDDAQVKREYVSTNVGGVQVTRAAAMLAPALPPLAPQAAAILHVAGVLPAAPLVNW
jgi:hypothetical protein